MSDEYEFSMVVGSRRLFHVDVEHDDGLELPLGTKPSWELSHFLPDGSPAPSSIGTLETSVNCRTGRVIAGTRPGTIIVTVNANVSAASHASTTFKIHVKPHPTTSSLLRFKVASHRDAPLH
jgi:hypothetical protein